VTERAPSAETPGGAALPPQARPGLGALLATVAEEARREAERVVAEARAHAQARVADAERTAGEIAAAASGAGATEGAREARRRIALAQIETRVELLRLRERHVEQAIERAARRLGEQAAAADAGAELLAGAIRGAAGDLETARVAVRLPDGLRGAVRRALARDPLEVTWADPEDVAPGVVVTTADGRRLVDLTVPAVVRRCHEAARAAAARALFGESEQP
jgi:vacuolar-type H+-ATPase subunit E/Vma4